MVKMHQNLKTKIIPSGLTTIAWMTKLVPAQNGVIIGVKDFLPNGTE